MTIKQYQEEIDNWIQTVGVRYFNELTNTVLLSEEVGELSRLMARVYGEQSFKIPMTKKQAKEKMADEMADILWIIGCIANQTGINLTEAIHHNFLKKNTRDSTRHKENTKLL